MISRVGAVLIFAVFVASGELALAEDLRGQVEGLFAKSNKVSPSALDAARKHYSEIQATGKSKRLVDYAFALVLIEQQKFEEASAALTELLKFMPDVQPFSRSSIWTQMVRRQYPEALFASEAIAKTLAGAEPGKATVEQHETARFLGVVIAFLEGPAATPKLEQPTADAKQAIFDSLNTELVTDFNRGFTATSDAFEKIRTSAATAKEELAKIQEEANRAQAEQIASEKESLEKSKEAVDEKTAKREQETEEEIASLRKKVESLQNQFTAAMILAAPLQARITQAEEEMRGLTQLVENADGTVSTTITNLSRKNTLEQFIGQLRAQLAPVQAQIMAINAQAMALQNKYGRLLRQHNIDLQKLTGKEQELAKQKKKLERIEKSQAKAKPSGTNVRTRALVARMTTFSTYEPFPFVREKGRVIQALK
jgi:hypothetical protein